MSRVLVVDDSALVRDLHAAMLSGGEYDVSQAENGMEALEMLLAERYDLIVSDVNMPKMDGLELTRRVRATDGYKTTPIILVSTEAQARDRLSGLRAGANVYVVKPVLPGFLVQNAKLLLGR